MRMFWTLMAAAFVVASTAFGAAVTADEAKAIASVWAQENAAFGAGGTAVSATPVCDTNAAKTVLWYHVSLSKGGALMVAPVTEIEPVLAALEEDPGDLPAAHPLRGILAGDMRGRLRFLGLYTEDGAAASIKKRLTMSAASSAQAQVAAQWGAQQENKWTRLKTKAGLIKPKLSNRLQEGSSTGVADPIATEIGIVPGFEKGGKFTHWNQGSVGAQYCYNLYTPKHAVCGCVATAAAAMMQFFEVEYVAPYSNKACTYNGKPYSATFGADAATLQSEEDPKTYDWTELNACADLDAVMELLKDNTEKGEAAREVLGRLAFDAGVCFGMAWTDTESGAFTTDTAGVMRNQFSFTEARNVNSPTQEQYGKLIYAQVRCGVPVGMGIKGHAVVAVGYGRDGDSVERVRVFMGWGGSGDAWYALPNIDTTAVLGGSSYLSTVVNSITTFISRTDDAVVPVVGGILPAMNATVKVGDTEVTANKTGYFGSRVSAATTGTLTISSQGKSVEVTLKGLPAVAESDKSFTSKGAELCAAVPDPVMLVLLNSEAAATVADAKAKALASGKPMLFFSGLSGDPACDAMWNIINTLDDNNIDDFTNKFVIAYFAWDGSPSSPSDGKPSYGVFDPEVYDSTAENHWASFNGRIAYDTFAACTTNITVGATNYVATAEAQARLMAVIEDGYHAYLSKKAGIALDVVSDPSNLVSVAWQDAFTNGEEVVYRAPQAMTNAANDTVYTCTNMTVVAVAADGTETDVTNSTDGVVTFNVAAQTAYRLTLECKVAQVRVTAEAVFGDDGVVRGRVTDGVTTNTAVSVWMKPGDEVTFKAVPEAKYNLAQWEAETPTAYIVTEEPVTFKASFIAAANYMVTIAETPALTGGAFLTDCTLEASDHKTATLKLGGKGYFASGDLKVTANPAHRVLNDVTWVIAGWRVTSAEGDGGIGPEAEFVLTGKSTLMWAWSVDLGATLAAKGWRATDPQTYTLNLTLPTGVTADQVTFANVPEGWQFESDAAAEGTLAVTLAPKADWLMANYGVTLTVVTANETEMFGEDIAALGAFTNQYAVMADDRAVIITAPAAYTNETTGWIWEPAAWAIPEISSNGVGQVACFTTNDVRNLTLSWKWKKTGVRLSAEFAYPELSVKANAAYHQLSTFDADEAWCKFGEEATFTVTPWRGTSIPEALLYWTCTNPAAYWIPDGLSVTVRALEENGPVTVVAVMGDAVYAVQGAVTVTNAPIATSVATVDSLPGSGAAQVWGDAVAVSLTAPTQVVADVTYDCTGWVLCNAADTNVVYASGTGTKAQFVPPTVETTLVWLWQERGAEPQTRMYTPDPIAFTTIEKTATGFKISFTNATKYCIYKLYASSTPAGFDFTADPVQMMTWLGANGETGSFEVPEGSGTGCFWRVRAEPGEGPVDDNPPN